MSNAPVPPVNEEELDWERYPYRAVLGALGYLVLCTRPDLAYCVYFLARSQARWDKHRWVLEAHCHLLHPGFLAGTIIFLNLIIILSHQAVKASVDAEGSSSHPSS